MTLAANRQTWRRLTTPIHRLVAVEPFLILRDNNFGVVVWRNSNVTTDNVMVTIIATAQPARVML